jgi:hypothetical protein
LEDDERGQDRSPSLWQIARNHQIDVRYTSAVLKELIRHTLLDGKYLRKLYQEELTTSEQQLLKILSLKDSPLSMEELRRQWLHFRWSVDITDLRNLLENLWAQGLIFLDVSTSETISRKVFLPRDLAFVIRNNFTREYRSPSSERHTFYVKKPIAQAVEPDSSLTARDDLILLLGYSSVEDVFMLGNDPNDPSSGRVHRKHWRRLMPHAKYQGDDVIDYLQFLFQFARHEMMIGKRGDRLVVIRENLPILRQPVRLSARMISFWLHFLDGSGYPSKGFGLELVPFDADAAHSPAAQPFKGAFAWESRQSLLAFLASLPPNRWMDLESFVITMIRQEWSMIETEIQVQTPVISEEVTNDIRQSLRTVFRWAGIIQVASGEPGRQEEFYLTKFGSNLLTGKESKLDHTASSGEMSFLVLANLEIILPPDLDPEVRFRLFDFVELKGNHSILTKDSIRRGLDNSWTENTITDFLKLHSRSPLPDNVAKFIKDVAERHGHIIIWANHRTVETRDAWLMTEIKSRRTIRPYLAELDKPDRARITPGKDPRRLLLLLRKAGYLPRWVS